MPGLPAGPGPGELRRTGLLEAAARGIHGEPDRERMAGWTVDAVAEAAVADWAALCLLDEPGPPRWTVSQSSPQDPARLGDPRTYPELAAGLRGEPSPGAHDDQLRRLLGVVALQVLVIPRGDGGVHGVALLGWVARGGAGADPTPPGAPSRQPDEAAPSHEAAALLTHLGVALDNHAAMVGMEAMQRDVVHKLQEAVRPPTPALTQTELGVYYLAADQRASTGGDLYDWIVLPNGELHLTVVDVMGKGVGATKDAVAVTHAVRLLVLDGCPLDRVVARADELVTAQNPDLVATLIVGRYDPRSGRLRLVGGGHPPALIVTPAGSVRQIPAGGIPIGFPGVGSDGEVTLTLERSDTVIFYTDGLIEASKDIVKGLAALEHHASETAGYPATSVARAMVDRALEGAVRNDDSLALVLRRRSPPHEAARLPLAPLEYRFTPTTAAVPLARHLLQDWLVRVPVAEDESSALALVASELCANAVRHATGQRGSVALRAMVDGADVVIEVEDDGGHPFALPDPTDDLPDLLAERGRGLFLVRALADSVESEVVDGRTIVRVVRRAVVARDGDEP